MISITKPSIAFTLSLLFVQVTTAQFKQPSNYSRWEVGGGISTFIYQGDLTPRKLGSFETLKPGFLVFGNYKLKNQLRLQAAFAMGKLKGNDAKYSKPAYRQERNFLFTTLVKELSLKLQYQIHKNYLGDEALLYPYISAGIAFNFFNIKKDYSGLSTKLSSAEPQILAGIAADDNHGTPKALISLPIVVGVRKLYNERWDLFAEANYRFVFTDYLDGFSKAANPSRNDKFYSISVGAIYKFRKNNSISCPKY
jgi:hypothetical protein